jgi:hypothetical protein
MGADECKGALEARVPHYSDRPAREDTRDSSNGNFLTVLGAIEDSVPQRTPHLDGGLSGFPHRTAVHHKVSVVHGYLTNRIGRIA